jgi:eukaryotic-like serine/threonine-protein kinase
VHLPTDAGLLAYRYRLESRIASGGMGDVWRGADLVLDRPVAVKLLRTEYAQHPETVARFRAEARHAAALSHPAIAQVYDFGEADYGRAPFLVMELVDGPPLTKLLADGPLEAAMALDVVAQVAAGLAAAHAAGVLHRDIKPGNLLVGPGGRVKITDFGISYAAGSAPLTRTGTVIGTPGYLAPERLTGAGAGPAGDVYSLGMVAYQCLAGRLPFAGTAVEIALAHQHQQLPPLPPSVPYDVAALIGDMTAKDPSIRPRSAGEVAARAASLRDAIAATANTPASQTGRSPEWQAAGAATDAASSTGWLPPSVLAGVPGPGDTAYLSGLGGSAAPDRARPRRVSRLLAAAAAIAILTIVGLTGWLIGNTQRSTSDGPAAGRQQSSPASRFVSVDAAAFIGQPARSVVHQLRALGFQVSVTKQHDPHQVPGTVVGVSPSGRLSVGTPITVTASTNPGQDGGDNGNGHDGGNHGNGQGGD